jgi:CysZ protein
VTLPRVWSGRRRGSGVAGHSATRVWQNPRLAGARRTGQGQTRPTRRNPLFTPILRAIGQLDDPALLGVLVKTVLLSLLCFAGLAAGGVWLLHHLLGPDGALGALGLSPDGVPALLLGWTAGALGGLAAIISALWLFLPLAVVIASLFMEPVCRAVERRWYPALPPARGAGIWPQLWEGVAIGLQVLALSLVSLLIALLVPVVGQVAGWAITAWAIGRGLFTAVAMRRMTRREALWAYRSRRFDVLVQAAVLTVAGTVPLANFLLPVLGPAAMVHVLLRAPRNGGRPDESWG